MQLSIHSSDPHPWLTRILHLPADHGQASVDALFQHPRLVTEKTSFARIIVLREKITEKDNQALLQYSEFIRLQIQVPSTGTA
jgi:hypothetical protein